MAFKDDDGRLNNFAREPKVYQAQPLTEKEKLNYIILALITVFLVGGLITVAIFASSVTTVS
ncbi:MAG: photosystem II assembly protein Psb34 [Snowella sp.]